MVRLTTPAILLAGLILSGCGAVAAGTAGGVIADEGVAEDDGAFDPLEDTEVGEEIYE